MAPNYPLAQDRATVLTVSRRMRAFDLDAWMARSRALDLSEIDWAAVRLCSVSSDTIRTLRYMQDIEFHTIIYMRKLLATRAIDDPEVATFLACWLHEETFHGLALASFLDAAGHPVLTELLERIMGDESRHFFFYYRQAEQRLQHPAPARVARLLVDRFWAPVGSGVGPADDLIFMARYLFAGDDGRAAVRRVDDTIRRLPGFATVRLLEAWMDRHVGALTS